MLTHRLNLSKLRAVFTLIIMLGFSVLSNAQEKDMADEKASVFLLTHLAVAESQDSCLQLSNQFDFKHPLKVYQFNHNKDTISCKIVLSTEQVLAATDPQKPYLLIIHGAGKTMEQTIEMATDIQQLYPVNVLIYHWPAMIGSDYDTKNLKGMKAKVEEGVQLFTELLHWVEILKNIHEKEGKTSKWSMFIHSMGNYYIERAVANNSFVNLDSHLFENIILNEAAVDSKNHAAWLNQLHIQKRIYVNSNKKDLILKGLRLFTTAGRQLGSKAKAPLSQQAIYIDFTSAVGHQKPIYKTHSFYAKEIPLQSENIRMYYAHLFNGEEIDLSNPNQFLPTKESNKFKIVF
ncbi:MAG: hypothetical protein JW729_05050 [Bacteroidales bacterium]|nr:hypothetical protein [Bacteroidales bacterium]